MLLLLHGSVNLVVIGVKLWAIFSSENQHDSKFQITKAINICSICDIQSNSLSDNPNLLVDWQLWKWQDSQVKVLVDSVFT